MRPPIVPVPVITSGFDLKRKHPIHGTVIPHTGVDFRAPVGTPVLASAPGVVVRSAFDPPRSQGGTGAGHLVGINHDNGLGTRYYHLSRIDVKQGQRVKAGQRIALSGNSGDSTGPHLHFEIRTGGYWGTPVNPVPYMSLTKEVIMTSTPVDLTQRIPLGGTNAAPWFGATSASLAALLRAAGRSGPMADRTHERLDVIAEQLPAIRAQNTAIIGALDALGRGEALTRDEFVTGVDTAAREAVRQEMQSAADQLVSTVIAAVTTALADNPAITADDVARLVLSGIGQALSTANADVPEE